MCHDYPPDGRAPAYKCTVAEQNRDNVHMREHIRMNAFVALRNARDVVLQPPVLMLAAIQVNIRAGELPEPEDNGVRYLKIPIDVL
jgi:hypothetical protein